jgi:hypothetical protein
MAGRAAPTAAKAATPLERTPLVDQFVEIVVQPTAEVLDVESPFGPDGDIATLHVKGEVRLMFVLQGDHISLARFNRTSAAATLVDDDALAHRHESLPDLPLHNVCVDLHAYMIA